MNSSPRRVLNLADKLPPESALSRGDGWSLDLEFQALAIERLEKWMSAMWSLTAIGKLEKPPKLVHPGETRILRPADARALRDEEAQKVKERQEGRKIDPDRLLSIARKLGMAAKAAA